MNPEELPPEVVADLDPNLVPLFPGHEGTPRHKVREHDRRLPPKEPPPDDPDRPRLIDLPPLRPKPRIVPVRRHVRRNPRRKTKETTMTTITPPTTEEDGHRTAATTAADLESTAHARTSDPATSHAAAKTVDLTRRQIQVLDAFQVRYAYDPGRGFTDEELVRDVQNAARAAGVTKIPSPSGLRTARKALQRAGLVEEKVEYDVLVYRRTELGNDAQVFVLTEDGRAFVIPS